MKITYDCLNINNKEKRIGSKIHWEDLSYDESKINKILDEIDFKKEYECIWTTDKNELK